MIYKLVTFLKENPAQKVTIHIGSAKSCRALLRGYRKFKDGQVYKIVSTKILLSNRFNKKPNP